jgi:hypothetical protein
MKWVVSLLRSLRHSEVALEPACERKLEVQTPLETSGQLRRVVLCYVQRSGVARP